MSTRTPPSPSAPKSLRVQAMNFAALRTAFLLLPLVIVAHHFYANTALLPHRLTDATLPRLLRDDLFAHAPLSASRPDPDHFAPARRPRRFSAARNAPLLTIITVTKDPRAVFNHTATAVRSQTLRPVRWLIVNDHTASVDAYARLTDAAARDARVVLLNHTGTPGFVHGRIAAIDYLHSHPTPYFAFLDDDDLFELTYYEKCAWMLTSATAPAMCGSHVVGFGDRNYTWTFGFHSGMRAAIDNPLTGSEVLRSSVLNATGCEFDRSLTSGMEDWDFYLCIASHGAWGATIPERLLWYRQNPAALRRQRWNSLFDDADTVGRTIRARYAKLASPDFPRVAVPAATELEAINETAPFANALARRRSAVLVTSWLAPGDTTAATLRLVKRLRAAGFRVSVACTLHDASGGHAQAWRAAFLRYTSDLFFLPAMLRLPDAPRFLAYLVRSRGASLVLVAHSRLAYAALPWLQAHFPRAVFADFVAADEARVRNGGYAALSAMYATSLDRTLVPDTTVRDRVVARRAGRRGASGVVVLHGDIIRGSAAPMRDEETAMARRALGLGLGDVVVVAALLRNTSIAAHTLSAAFARAVEEADARIGRRGLTVAGGRVRLVVAGETGAVSKAFWHALGARSRDVVLASDEAAETLVSYVKAADIVAVPARNGPDYSVARAAHTALDAGLHMHGQADVVRALSGGLGDAKTVATRAKRDTVEAILSKFLRDTVLDVVHARTRGESDSEQALLWNGSARERRELEGWVTRRTRRASRGAGSVGTEEERRQLQYGQSTVLREVGALSDFGVAQNELQGKPRGEFGALYRARCGEWDASVSRLIDLLERPVACDGGAEVRVARLQELALTQCGRWCIMDSDDKAGKSGWQVVEKCGVRTFDDASHKCSVWYEKVRADEAAKAKADAEEAKKEGNVDR